MPARKLRLALGLLLALLPLTGSGCAALAVAGAAGAGVAYARGDVNRTYPRRLEEVWFASQMAMADLELTPTFEAKDQFSGRMETITASGDKLKLTLANQGEVTSAKVRVNTFGDEAISQALLSRIEAHLR